MLAVLAVGAGFYRNYMRIAEPSVDSTVTVMSDNTVEESEDNQADAVREVTKTPEITWIEEITKALEETDEQPGGKPADHPTIQPGAEKMGQKKLMYRKQIPRRQERLQLRILPVLKKARRL